MSAESPLTDTQEKKTESEGKGGVLAGLLLMLISVVFTLLLIEVFMRVGFNALPPQIQGDIQAVRRVPWSEERIIQPVPFIADRTLQARLEPGINDFSVRWQDARFTFDTGTVWDGHPIGLRTTGPQWPLDILAFGDSFAFCWTAVDDCWVQRLGSAYGWNTVNAGLPGTGSGGQLALIKDIAAPLESAVVLWQWYPNDLQDNYNLAVLNQETDERELPPAPPAAAEPSGLAQYSALLWLIQQQLDPVDDPSGYQHYTTVNVDGRDLLVGAGEYPHPFTPEYDAVAYGWERDLAAHREGAAYIQDEVGATMVLVLVPTKEEVYAEQLADAIGADYLDAISQTRRQLLETCADEGWHCIDPLPAFRAAIAEGETVYYALDFHLDASGNRILADVIHEYLLANDLLE